MKRILSIILCMFAIGSFAQDITSAMIKKAISGGIILFRQDYQLLNEDDEPIANKSGLDCYGRTYTCGVRLGESDFLVIKDFVAPWTNDAIVKSEKRHPEISYSGFLTLNTVDFEQFDCDVEAAEEIVPNHIYKVGGSEIEGFEIDQECGRKKGYAVWLKAENNFSPKSTPTGLSIDIVPFDIATNEKALLYDLKTQPEGNIVGGVFFCPIIEKLGDIKLKINGIFEKRGGVWKFISLATEGSDEE